MRVESVPFTALDGRELVFLFDHRGIVAAEKAGDGGFGELLIGMSEGRLGCLTALVYGGLKTNHPEMTPEAAWDLLEAEGEALGNALGEAIRASKPGQRALRESGANPPKGAPRQRRRPGTGTRSSARGSKKA